MPASLNSVAGALQWILAHGYLLMFIAMLIEGPIVTVASSFAAALGYFNIFFVFIIAVLGDVIADIIYFAVGYWGRIGFIEKYGGFIGLPKPRIAKLEKHFKLHAGKTLFAVKFSPAPVPGLIAAGISKMPAQKFAKISLVVTLPRVLFFLLLGFYFGHAYNTLDKIVKYAEIFPIIVAVISILLYFIFKKVSDMISEEIEPFKGNE